MPRRYAYYLSMAAVLAGFVAFAWIEFGRLFLLIEYRQWAEAPAFFNPLSIFFPGTVFNPHAFSVVFSRAFSLETVAAFTAVCGPDATCHNAFHIALLAASGLLLGAALFRLFPDKPVLFIAGAVAFMFSAQPVTDALVWQATLHDKLALFFCALGTYAAIRIDLRRADLPYVAGVNVAILLIAAAAYNSKEAAFPLVPSLLILLLCRALGAGELSLQSAIRAARRSLTFLALPALYALFHITVVFLDRTVWSAAEEQRLTGGHAGFNLYQYVVYLFNLQAPGYFLHLYPYASQTALYAFAVFLLAIAACSAFLAVRIASRRAALTWIWAMFSFIVAMLIPLRTSGPSPFYLLVPLFYLAILLCASAVIAWDAVRTAAAKTAVQVAVGFALALHVWWLAWPYPAYAHIAQMSDNFTSALSAVQKRMRPSPRGILFRWPQSETLSYMFLGPKDNHALARYLLPPGTRAATLASVDATIQDEPYAELPGTAAKPGELIVVLGPALKLERIEPSR